MWRKSSFCNGAAACVEVAFVEGVVTVRDAKDPYGAVLLFTPEEWAAFTAGVRDGEFDLPALAADAGDGSGEDARSRAHTPPLAAS